MSIENYQKLQKQSEDDNSLLGMVLPQLNLGSLNTEQQLLDTQQTIQFINELAPTQGWILYRDKLELSARAPERKDFIEAEYSNGQDSLLLKLIGDNQYSVCLMKLETNGSGMVYKTQQLNIREALGGAQLAEYKIWFKQDTTELNQGRWEPFAQQFIGFTPLSKNIGE